MKRKNIKGIFSKPMDPKADPVIENKRLAAMPEVEQKQPGQIKNPPTGKGYMPLSSDEQPKLNKTAITKGQQMAPFTLNENKKIKAIEPEMGYHDQLEKNSRKINAPGYVVLKMRVQDGQVSVIGSRKVEGAFIESENLIQSGIIYEAFKGNNRIAIGSIPDFGEQRSFPRPDADPDHEGHHITILPGFDFNLKVSAEKITLKELPEVKVTLYKFKELIPELHLTEAPLKVQFPKAARVVAEMNGIRVKTLNKEVIKSLEKTLK